MSARANAAILGMGTYVPDQRLTNAELERLVDTNDEWIVTRTGIRERRILPKEEGTSHMAARAAQEALAHAGVSPGEIDLIIAATATPDLNFPPVACLVQRAIGAERAAAFDVNAVCSGFLYATVIGSQFVTGGAYRRVLVLGADTVTRHVDYSDRATCILFGDGAGAAVLGPVQGDVGLLDYDLHSDGRLAHLVYAPHERSPAGTLAELQASSKPYIWQDGRAVFKVAVQGMAASVETVLARQGLTTRDIAVLVPHQANGRIMSALAGRLDLPAERVADCIAEYGNTSAATIPLALHKWLRERGLKKGDHVVFTAFAGGLLWGAALLRWHVDMGA